MRRLSIITLKMSARITTGRCLKQWHTSKVLGTKSNINIFLPVTCPGNHCWYDSIFSVLQRSLDKKVVLVN